MKIDPFFLPYQQRWIEDRSRLKLMEKSRQIGLSWCSAYACVRRQAEGAPLDTWISSRDETQAKLFLEDCSAFAGVLNIAAQNLGLQVLDGTSRSSAFALEFASGRRIHSMSSNPDAQAGKRGTRVLDEFALHPDPRRLYAVAYPGITWGGQLEIISTHRGANGFFNELVREIREKGNPKGFSLHRVTLEDALEQGFLQKLKKKLPAADPRLEMDDASYYDFIRASCADEESFRQEYCCVPADDASAFLGWDIIAACEYDESEAWEGSLCNAKSLAGNPLYLGVDVGRDHDLTVFWLVELAGDVVRTRLIECLATGQRDVWQQDFEANFEVKLEELCNAEPIMGTEFISSGLGERKAFVSHRANFIALVNERAGGDGGDFVEAWTQLKRERPDLYEELV